MTELRKNQVIGIKSGGSSEVDQMTAVQTDPGDVPLCVDLDGTLLQTDTLHEGLILLLKKRPLALLKIPLWLRHGRANLKREITKRIDLDVGSLPANRAVLDYLGEEEKKGRKLVLVTAADVRVGEAVAQHFGIFSDVLSSDGALNLSGERKAAALNEKFGRGRFDYIGNAAADVPIWAVARRALVVNPSETTLRKAKQAANVERVFNRSGNRALLLFRALRPHQWSKNLLLFIPLAGAHKWTDSHKLSLVIWAFIAFSLCASSVYMLNDLLDLRSDRRHSRKRLRPFASAELPVSWGIVGSPLLLIGSLLMIFRYPPAFIITFLSYYTLTFFYSLRLKQIALLDVFVLASLYGLRVLAGGFAAQVTVSDWLMVFSLFFFLSLAFAKRSTEIKTGQRDKGSRLWGRGYHFSDEEMVTNMGVVSGYIAVVILALYVTNPVVTELYVRPVNLLFACPLLLYWISRVWLLAHRHELHDDPIVFALTDVQSWLVLFGLAGVVLLSGPK